jgi:Cu/Ag efflux protein CusF
VKSAVLCAALLTLAACSQTKTKVAEKQYPLTGKVVSIDAKAHTAMIDAAPIPNFMDAMKMDYPIASDSDLASLKVGENISATVEVGEDGSYSLSNIHDRSAGEAGK